MLACDISNSRNAAVPRRAASTFADTYMRDGAVAVTPPRG